ncbi:MAG: PAS domain S-box protein [Anaerolineae bacterium]|nr:PAS domain S-box protein [Anaerolineae bacterium]
MRRSIRTRLTVAFTGLAIGPLLLVGVILAWQSFITQKQLALNLQREVSWRVATEVTAFFDELENELRLVSKAQMWPGLNQNGQHNLLTLLMSQDVYEELVLLDRQGQEQIHLSRLGLSSTTPGHYSQANEFIIPQTTNEVYYSPVRFDEVTGEPLMTIAVPLLNVRTGLVEGVLVAKVRIKKIWDLIAEIRVDPGQSVYIVDAQDKVVAHRNPSVVLRGTTFAAPAQDGIQPGFTGSSAVLAVVPTRFGEQEFNIVAEQTVLDALALAINTVFITIILIMAVFLISGILGFLIVRQIIRPIQAMAATVEAISAGDLSQQVEITRPDELGILAGAFNNMTGKLRRLINDLEQQIVERKQAEQALRESEERLRQIASSLREIVWLRDAQTRQVLYVNPAFEELTGRTCEDFYENPDIMRDAIHPDDREGVLKAIEQRSGSVPFDTEHRIIHLDGSVRWVSSRSFPVRNEAGEVYRWASIMEDITERKQAEEALRESEDRFRIFADEVSFEGIIIHDRGEILDVNRQFSQMHGYEHSELIGMTDSLVKTIAPEYHEFVLKHIQEGHEKPYEAVALKKDGSTFPIEIRAKTIPFHGKVVRATAIRDITERVRAEEEIRTLNAELEQRVARRTRQIETVAEISQQLTSILDLPTLLRQVVAMTKETFGYYHVHIYLLPAEGKTLIMAEGYGAAGAKMKQQGHQIPLDAPTSLVAGAARRREIVLVNDVRQAPDWLPNPLLPDTHSEMAVPIIAEEKVIGVLDVQSNQVAGLDEADKDLLRSLANQIAVALTNAQLYQTEQALRQAEAERAEELARLNADLQATQAELLRQERLATLGKLTATVSHEIRNPLATIRASAFSLDRQTRDRGLGVERALDRIERNVSRCDNIITELLDYTRLGELDSRLVFFDDWLNQMLAEQIIPADITLSVNLAAGVEVWLDPERFRRVIVNLVDNACQALQEESKPNQLEKIVRVQTEVVAEQIKLSIIDTGPGIPPEMMPHIFEPLYSTKGFGVGLGLPVVQGIVKQHGGKIELNSEMGRGTQVVIWLPLP